MLKSEKTTQLRLNEKEKQKNLNSLNRQKKISNLSWKPSKSKSLQNCNNKNRYWLSQMRWSSKKRSKLKLSGLRISN